MSAQATRARIFSAAVTEFAEHGRTAARVSAIAKRAGVNVERVYHYFGNKDGLFAAVVASAAARLSAAEPFDAARLGESVASGAAFHAADPRLARLLLSEGHALGAAADSIARASFWRERVEAIRAQQGAGVVRADLDARAIAFAVVALTLAATAVPHVTEAVLASGDPLEPARFHAELARLVGRLTAAGS